MMMQASISPLLETRNLRKYFQLPGGWLTRKVRYVQAVDDISISVQPGEILGIVGESGCGKTTLGRLLLRLVEPTSGAIFFNGTNISALNTEDMRHIRRNMQIVFQNPYSSLSPRYKILDILSEPLLTHKLFHKRNVKVPVLELLERVGLGPHHLDRFPHELSGGQCQRVAIARALAVKPKLLVLDEPTSSLDVSVQAQIINLLMELKEEEGFTYVFISHDLNVVQHVSEKIGVMYLGKLVEIGSSDEIFSKPLHPYTQALFGSIPLPIVDEKRELVILEGNVPSPVDPPNGCRFHTRCPMVMQICKEQEPLLRQLTNNRIVACHLMQEN